MIYIQLISGFFSVRQSQRRRMRVVLVVVVPVVAEAVAVTDVRGDGYGLW